MPIEIRELQIKAVVQSSECNTKNNANTKSSFSPSDTNIDDIVERCIEQVLAILKEKQER